MFREQIPKTNRQQWIFMFHKCSFSLAWQKYSVEFSFLPCLTNELNKFSAEFSCKQFQKLDSAVNFHVSQGKFSCCVAKFQRGFFDVGPESSQISALNFYLWPGSKINKWDSEVDFRVLQVKFSTRWRKFSGYFFRFDQRTKKFSPKFWSELENFSGEYFMSNHWAH